MAGNYTLTIIKPDAFTGGKTGKILALLEAKGFVVRAARAMQLTKEQAGALFDVRRPRPFSGPAGEVMGPRPGTALPRPNGQTGPALRAGGRATAPAGASAGTGP